MNSPRFEPKADNLFRIVHPAVYTTLSAEIRKAETAGASPVEMTGLLKDVLHKYPWHFEAAYRLAGLQQDVGDFQAACNTRFRACRHLMELLPEEDEDSIALDWEARENQAPMLLLHGSGIDHFLVYEFEMAAALFETLLDLDEEDHQNASQPLACCYVALNEPESFEAVWPDLDDKSAEKALVALWAHLEFDRGFAPGELAEFKQRFPEVYREFTADSHPVDEAYLADVDSERPSKAARARLLWLQTEHLWAKYPEFVVALKTS